jgi:hypothetical protein
MSRSFMPTRFTAGSKPDPRKPLGPLEAPPLPQMLKAESPRGTAAGELETADIEPLTQDYRRQQHMALSRRGLLSSLPADEGPQHLDEQTLVRCLDELYISEKP